MQFFSYHKTAYIHHMKISLQYLNDINGKTQAVQMPISDWKKIIAKLRKYEQAIKLRGDIKEALNQVTALNRSNKHKQTLKEFLIEV